MAEWYAGQAEDFQDEVRVIVNVNGREVAVLKVDGVFHALANTCLHAGGPVGEGLVMGRVCAVLDQERRLVREEFSEDEMQIVCPWHGWAYDLATGAFAGDASLRLRKFSVKVGEEGVYVIA